MLKLSHDAEQGIKLTQADVDVAWTLRGLAANLMRVSRGAGKPGEIGCQAQAVTEAMQGFKEVVGHYPPAHNTASHLNGWVRSTDPEIMDEGSLDRRSAENALIGACLQLVASRLLEQHTQESTAVRELYVAVDRLGGLSDHKEKLPQPCGGTAPRANARK